MTDARYETGLRVRREVLGEAHVARALARQTELDADFQRFITESAWGGVWARPDLDRRTRSLTFRASRSFAVNAASRQPGQWDATTSPSER